VQADPTNVINLGQLSTLSLKPGDVVVVTYPDTLSMKAMQQMVDCVKNAGVKNRVLVLDSGGSLGVLRQDQWVPVEDRLPETRPDDTKSDIVLVLLSDGQRLAAEYRHADSMWLLPYASNYLIQTVTHWQPMPAHTTEGHAS
jgi:hypothetical protein